MKKLTPVLAVEEIEPCLEFWVERLGFDKTVEVPHGDRLGFVILAKDGCEVMLQTFASMADDAPQVAPPPGGTLLFIEVEDIGAMERALAGLPVVVPRRETPYGATEIFVREPGRHVVGFAEFSETGG